jgi:hypothetical protein
MLEKDPVKFQKKLSGLGWRGGWGGGLKCGKKIPDEIATSIRAESQSI